MNQTIEAEREIPPIRKQSLFELGIIGESLQAQLEQLLHESEGEVTAEIEELMDSFLRENSESVATKLDAIGALLSEWKARAEGRRAEAERLIKLMDQDEAKIARMKQRVQIYLELVGKDKVETPRYKFSIAGHGGVLPLIIDEDFEPADLHPDYQKVTVDYDRKAIREALSQPGVTLGFAKLGERGRSLRIR